MSKNLSKLLNALALHINFDVENDAEPVENRFLVRGNPKYLHLQRFVHPITLTFDVFQHSADEI